jgi:hypothetical protein
MILKRHQWRSGASQKELVGITVPPPPESPPELEIYPFRVTLDEAGDLVHALQAAIALVTTHAATAAEPPTPAAP